MVRLRVPGQIKALCCNMDRNSSLVSEQHGVSANMLAAELPLILATRDTFVSLCLLAAWSYHEAAALLPQSDGINGYWWLVIRGAVTIQVPNIRVSSVVIEYIEGNEWTGFEGSRGRYTWGQRIVACSQPSCSHNSNTAL